MKALLKRFSSSLRVRATLGATSVVAVALLIGVWGTLQLLENRLLENLDQQIETQALDRAQFLEDGAAPADLIDGRLAESFVWIGTADGHVEAAGGLDLQDPVELFVADDTGTTNARPITVSYREPGEAGELETSTVRVSLVVTTREVDGQPLVVIVGAEDEVVGKNASSARTLLLLGVPLAVALVAAVIWATLGRVFGPVERIREQADLISGSQLQHRVPTAGRGDEVDRLAVTMNSMLGRLDKHDSSQRQFASDASHELKTPVANVRALVETWDPQAGSWQEQHDRLLAETDRMAALVDDLLFVSVNTEAQAEPVPIRVHLDDLVFDEAALLKERDGHHVDVNGVAPVNVVGSSEDIRRVLRNLATNAARHTATTVWFSCIEADGLAIVTVADDGPGIPVADRLSIFDRFARGESARDRQSGGTGLGLAIAKQIMTAHQGSIEVDERPGGGARFTAKLPLA